MTSKQVRLSKTATLDEYFEWLCDLVDIVQPHISYNQLGMTLHDKPFYWTVPNDDNRAFEGIGLREKFCEENNIEYVLDYFPEQASMLELLIALAYRCEAIMADMNESISMVEWFWKMLSHVGLDRFTDVPNPGVWEDYEVERTLDRIIDRRYMYDGRGGLFPLEHPNKDQRKVELWYQMSSYLLENYYNDDIIE